MTFIAQTNPLTGLPYREITEEMIEMGEKLTSIRNIDVKIYAHKTHVDAVIPQVAYNGTSMCFDLTCVEDTRIFSRSSAVVPNGLNLTIDQDSPYGMVISLRSSLGFKKELVPHYGDVDAGYTGDFAVKVYNLSDEDIFIKKGERYAQVKVIKKPNYVIQELNDEQFEELKQKQLRGSAGFGSSGK